MAFGMAISYIKFYSKKIYSLTDIIDLEQKYNLQILTGWARSQTYSEGPSRILKG